MNSFYIRKYLDPRTYTSLNIIAFLMWCFYAIFCVHTFNDFIPPYWNGEGYCPSSEEEPFINAELIVFTFLFLLFFAFVLELVLRLFIDFIRKKHLKEALKEKKPMIKNRLLKKIYSIWFFIGITPYFVFVFCVLFDM